MSIESLSIEDSSFRIGHGCGSDSPECDSQAHRLVCHIDNISHRAEPVAAAAIMLFMPAHMHTKLKHPLIGTHVSQCEIEAVLPAWRGAEEGREPPFVRMNDQRNWVRRDSVADGPAGAQRLEHRAEQRMLTAWQRAAEHCRTIGSADY